MSTPLKVFCCYAREDQALLTLLIKHLDSLRRQGKITIWSDINLNAGVEWEKELHQHLESADIILLLISPDFISSDYYSTEMERAIQRQIENSARVIPILLRPCYWENTPFAKLRILPTNAKAVMSWSNPDAAFDEITRYIDRVVTSLQPSVTMSSPLSVSSVNISKTSEPKVSGWLLIAIFLICAIVQTILIINNVSLPLSILNGLITIAGLFLTFQQTFGNHISLGKFTIPHLANRWLATILCLFLVISLSGNVFFVLQGRLATRPVKNTPVAKSTSTAQITPISTTEINGPTSTAPSTLSLPGSPIINDPMSGPDQDDQWDVINQPYLSCGFVNGVYQLRAPANKGGGCGTNSSKAILHNFIYEIQMTIVQGIANPSSGAGLIFRYDAQKDAGYTLSFRQDGSYLLYYATNQLSITKTITVGNSQNFHKGANQANRIDIKMIDSTINIFVNGTYLTSAIDDNVSKGNIGVQMGSGTDTAQVNFSNLKIWVI